MDGIETEPLLEVAARLRRRELTSATLVDRVLARIAAADGELRCYAAVTADRARAAARRADEALDRGEWRGLLHGVPIALKDLVDTAGIETAAGMRALAGRVPAEDAAVAARLESAGAVLLGKTKLTEGAFSEHHPDVPAPRNPWGAGHWTGISSSGSGVAVAAGLCFAAIGSDTGGSIRFPSAACGVTGLKPSRGRVSRHGVFPLAPSLDHVGPMARDVGGCAAMLGAIAGRDARDPISLRVPVPDCIAALERPVQGMRIGLDRDHALTDVDPRVAAAFEAALEVLAAAGADIAEVRLPPADALVRGWTAACAAEAAFVHQRLYEERGGEYGPALRMLVEMGRALRATDLVGIEEARRAFAGALPDMFDAVDLIALPALPMPVPSLAELGARAGDAQAVFQTLRFTAPWNFSGSPTLSLPCGFDAAGLPIGFQLVGPALGEEALLAAGAGFQRETDWHERRPPA